MLLGNFADIVAAEASEKNCLNFTSFVQLRVSLMLLTLSIPNC